MQSLSLTKIHSAASLNRELDGVTKRVSYDKLSLTPFVPQHQLIRDSTPDARNSLLDLDDIDFGLTPTPLREDKIQSDGLVQITSEPDSLCKVRSPSQPAESSKANPPFSTVTLEDENNDLNPQMVIRCLPEDSINNFKIFEQVHQGQLLKPQGLKIESKTDELNEKKKSTPNKITQIKETNDNLPKHEFKSDFDQIQDSIDKICSIENLNEVRFQKENKPPSYPASENQTPQFANPKNFGFIPPPPKIGIRPPAPKKPELDLVHFDWVTLNETGCGLIFSHQIVLNNSFQSEIQKHFKKRQLVKKTEEKPTQLVEKQDQTLDGIFDYQRSIIIQTSLLRNSIDTELLDKIDRSLLTEIQVEQLQCILSIYPREQEIKLLVYKLADIGLRSFSEGLDAVKRQQLKCGKIEHFMLKLLAYPNDIRLKADTMLKIQEFSNRIDEQTKRIKCWKAVCDQLLGSQMFRDTVCITLKLGMLLNQQTNVKGFNFIALLRLFELKSTIDKEKCAYQFVIKQYMEMYRLDWTQISSEIVPDTCIQEIKNLVEQQQILQELQEIGKQKDYFGQLAQDCAHDVEFQTMLLQFCQYYEMQVREKLRSVSLQFQSTITQLSGYLGTSDELIKVLTVIIEFANKHQKFVIEYKRKKQIKNQVANLKSKQRPIPSQTLGLSNFTPSQQTTPRAQIRKMGSNEKITEQATSGAAHNQNVEKLEKKKLVNTKQQEKNNGYLTSARSQNITHSPGVKTTDKPPNLATKRFGSPQQQLSSLIGSTQHRLETSNLIHKPPTTTIQIIKNEPMTPHSSMTALQIGHKKTNSEKGSFVQKQSNLIQSSKKAN